MSIERVLLAQRVDGKFLRLDERAHTTSFDYTDDPVLAKRIYPHDAAHLESPREAAYYFENSWRARSLWLKDCAMVPYEITTEVKAVALSPSTPEAE